MKKYYIIFLIIGVFLYLQPCLAVTSLNNLNLQIVPKVIDQYATWTISFSVPKTMEIGHLLISLGGYKPDLSQASLTVSGLPSGQGQLGKSNPTCASNCDDIRYKLEGSVEIEKDSQVVLTITNVKNPSQVEQVGINYISVYSSLYPMTDLVFSGGDKYLKLSAEEGAGDENLIPDTVTSEEAIKEIKDVLINELFYQPGSTSTKLTKIENAQNVEDFTLDLIDKVKVVFKEPVDLSSEEAIHYISNLADYMTFEYLYFWIDYNMMSFFKVPLEITYYDLPYVWEPDIIKDDQFILENEEIENFRSKVVDDKSQISFIIREAGGYRIIPRLELYIEDNLKITDLVNHPPFAGRISDPTANLTISLNGKELKDKEVTIDSQTGDFSFRLDLIDGSNLIEIEADSVFGEIAKVTKIVHYQDKTQVAQEPEAKYLNPIYYVIGGLLVLGIILIFVIRFLVKNK